MVDLMVEVLVELIFFSLSLTTCLVRRRSVQMRSTVVKTFPSSSAWQSK